MSVRLPLTAVLDYNQTAENGAGVAGSNASTAGGVAKQFIIPQDTDNIVVKIQASIKGGGVSATLQTSDDEGTTWWDVARSSIVSNANATVTSEWLSVPVIGVGVRTTISGSSSTTTGTTPTSVHGATGRAGASTIGQLAVSGLPILSLVNRVFLQYTAAITSIIGERVTVYVNSQSPRA